LIEALGATPRRLISGALHEASALSTMAPTAMIFTACRLGISHSEDDHSEPADLVPGCRVLLRAALAGTHIL